MVSSNGEKVMFTVKSQLLIAMLALVQITKEDVDSFETGREIPSCQIRAEWIKQGEPSQLRQKVNLIGAQKPYDYFNIMLDCIPPDTTRGELLEKLLYL